MALPYEDLSDEDFFNRLQHLVFALVVVGLYLPPLPYVGSSGWVGVGVGLGLGRLQEDVAPPYESGCRCVSVYFFCRYFIIAVFRADEERSADQIKPHIPAFCLPARVKFDLKICKGPK